jgi:hypothetical protein
MNGRRPSQEDSVLVLPIGHFRGAKERSKDEPADALFAVFDGHGGARAAQLCSEQFAEFCAPLSGAICAARRARRRRRTAAPDAADRRRSVGGEPANVGSRRRPIDVVEAASSSGASLARWRRARCRALLPNPSAAELLSSSSSSIETSEDDGGGGGGAASLTVPLSQSGRARVAARQPRALLSPRVVGAHVDVDSALLTARSSGRCWASRTRS